MVLEGRDRNQSQGQKQVDLQPTARHREGRENIYACDANFTN